MPNKYPFIHMDPLLLDDRVYVCFGIVYIGPVWCDGVSL